MKRVALLGGSFCPVHNGHIHLADYIANHSGLVDEVWLVLSPLNPLKQPDSYTLTEQQRLQLLRLAVQHHPRLRVCDIELTLPRPSYTINTLRALSQLHPRTHFTWLIGSDHLATLNQWRDIDTILRDYGLLIYPRPGYPIDPLTLPAGAIALDAPVSDISSTRIRSGLATGADMSPYLPPLVWRALCNM